jgi:hypothetical protein
VLEVVGGSKYRWSVKDLFKIASARSNPKSCALPCGQCDQSIIDRGVSGCLISKQRDVARKRASGDLNGISVGGFHDRNVDRVAMQRQLDVLDERVHPGQRVEPSYHDLGGWIPGCGEFGGKHDLRSGSRLDAYLDRRLGEHQTV